MTERKFQTLSSRGFALDNGESWVRYISGNQQPDHWTISEFRRRHHKALGELFVRTIKLAQKAGMVKLVHLAVDGTKITANASIHSVMSYERMKKEEERLKQEIAELLKQMETNDTNEDRQYGNRRGDELPNELAIREKRLEAIEKAKKNWKQKLRKSLSKNKPKGSKRPPRKGKVTTRERTKKNPKLKPNVILPIPNRGLCAVHTSTLFRDITHRQQ